MNLKIYQFKYKKYKEEFLDKLEEMLDVGISNFNRGFFILDKINIKNILERINFANNFFNSSLLTQEAIENNFKNTSDKLDSSKLLTDTMIENLQQSLDAYNSTKPKNVHNLQNLNRVSFDVPKIVKAINLKIDNLSFDDTYKFELEVVSYFNFQEEFVLSPILPIQYAGHYIESVIFSDDNNYKSRFRKLHGSDISITDLEDNLLNIPYVITEEGYIEIDNENLSSKEYKLIYVPNESAYNIVSDKPISKIILHTNMTSNSNKYILLVGDESV